LPNLFWPYRLPKLSGPARLPRSSLVRLPLDVLVGRNGQPAEDGQPLRRHDGPADGATHAAALAVAVTLPAKASAGEATANEIGEKPVRIEHLVPPCSVGLPRARRILSARRPGARDDAAILREEAPPRSRESAAAGILSGPSPEQIRSDQSRNRRAHTELTDEELGVAGVTV
jgi:hypothetical protein